MSNDILHFCMQERGCTSPLLVLDWITQDSDSLDFDLADLAVHPGGRRAGGEGAVLVETGGCHAPERHVNPVIFQQRRDNAKLVQQRLHPIRDVVYAARP